MHTIEASVLVPLGLGIICVFIMLTFFLHDQTVLTAEYSSFLLEWQTCPGAIRREECEAKAEQWADGLLITSVYPIKISAGNSLCWLQTGEEYRLFEGALSLVDQELERERRNPVLVSAKIDPCWIKRIWKVTDTE